MRRWVPILYLAFLFFAYRPAYAMLDFDSVSTITAPERIMSFYLANVLGDSVDEIIVRCQFAAYVYDAYSSELLFTPPVINIPNNFKFRDMNNDGHAEFIYDNSNNVIVYDIVDSNFLWTSPTLSQPFVYGIGDRNSDGYLDIVIIRWNPTSIDLPVDSALVDIYDGPEFQLGGQTWFEINRFDWGSTSASEVPYAVYVKDLSGAAGIVPRVIIFTDRDYYHSEYDPHDPSYFQNEYAKWGRIILIDPQTYSLIAGQGGGLVTALNIDSTGNLPFITSVLSYEDIADGYGFPRFTHLSKVIANVNADTIEINHIIWRYDNYNECVYYDWAFYLLDDINSTNPGMEVLYGTGPDTLNLGSCMDSVVCWSLTGIPNYLSSPRLYHNPSIFESPQLVFGRPPVTRSGINGEITGLFNRSSFVIDTFADINHDGEDELINNISNHLYIYHISGTPEVSIEDDYGTVPSSFILYPNYPNPFNARTTIQYYLPAESNIRIEIYDIAGRKIESLLKDNCPAGVNQITWDALGRSSGIYFYTLGAGDRSKTGRMILLK
jgi:hypothetical protein